jgi:hypothetical protein
MVFGEERRKPSRHCGIICSIRGSHVHCNIVPHLMSPCHFTVETKRVSHLPYYASSDTQEGVHNWYQHDKIIGTGQRNLFIVGIYLWLYYFTCSVDKS